MIKEPRRFFSHRQFDRLMVIACLVFVIALSWSYLLAGAGMGMEQASMSKFMHQTEWDVGYAFTMFTMWWVMMAAMMLPSALPMILLFTSLNQKMGANSPVAVIAFVAAYLLIWGGFSAIAASCQWWLVQHDLMAAMKRAFHCWTVMILKMSWYCPIMPVREAISGLRFAFVIRIIIRLQ